MEDFLSIVIIILIAVASAASKSKKKKAKSSGAGNPQKAGTDGGFGEMKEFIRDMGKSVLDVEDDEEYASPAKMKPAKMKAKTAAQPVKPAKPAPGRKASIIEEGLGMPPPRSTQGVSLFEAQGCIGGSIAHDSHEGDSSYPYGASEGTLRGTGASPYAGEIAEELQSLNVQRLRRAIVVSEILDRPKALRRR